MSAARELAPRPVTAEELYNLPEDGRLYELWRGELRWMAPPGAEHGHFGQNLGAPLSVFIADHDLGRTFLAETGFRLARQPDTVLAPDWAFIRAERVPPEMPAAYLELAPDAVLEVRSPGQSHRQVQEKVDAWLEAGVRLVLDLDPRRGILTLHRAGRGPEVLQSGDTFAADDVIPGFSLEVSRIFRV